MNNLAFKDHPYSYNILGNKENIDKFTSEKVQSLHQDNIANKEILISYCGDLSLEEVTSIVSEEIKDLKPRQKKKLIKKPFKPVVGSKEFIEFDREQTQIFHFIPSAKLGSKENIVLKMIATHLSGQSSELFVEVRDKQGLCYTAQPIHFTALEAGYWGVYMASGHDKVTPAVKAIKEISIYNLLGKQVMSLEINKTSESIDVSNLSAGIYLVRYEMDNAIGTSKFIKQ